MRSFVFFLFFVVLASSVSAFDCSYFSGYKYAECNALLNVSEDLISDLIYNSSFLPDHEFISEYNDDIVVDSPPDNYSYSSSGVIKDAWVSLLAISPSIKYQDDLFVPSSFNVRSEYDYRIQIPNNVYGETMCGGCLCKKLYFLASRSELLSVKDDGVLAGNDKNVQCNVAGNSTISSTLEVWATTKEDVYKYRRYCCAYGEHGCTSWCYSCDYRETHHYPDYLKIEDTQDVKLYENNPIANFTFISEYYNTSKTKLQKSDGINFLLSFNSSYFQESVYSFGAEFIKKPFYLLQLTAKDISSRSQKNLIRNNNTFYIKDVSNCQISYADFFEQESKECDYTYIGEEVEEIESTGIGDSWMLLLKIAVFFLVLYLIYTTIKKTWGKILIPVLLLLIISPTVLAAEETTCGITNLASCIPAKIYDFILEILNAPLEPFITVTRLLLESPPTTDIFQGLWSIIIYCLSMFYGLLIIYSGFQFMISGHDVIRRAMAKEWLKNTIMMIVLIQSSFYLYDVILEIGSGLTTSVLSMVDPHFFMITADNLFNIGLEFIFVFFYALTLFITLLFLAIRYMIVAFGVLFAPIGIFCYFIPPLRSYGKLILNLLGMFIFITFLDAIIILACSMMITIPIFESMKILVVISCFNIINLLFFILTKHIISKSSMGDGTEKVAQAVKYIAMFA